MADKIPSIITGGSGFIGANLARRLISRRHGIHIFSRKENNWRLSGIEDNVVIHKVDLCDEMAVKSAVSKINPVYVYHLATYGGYPGQSDFHKTIYSNVVGTLNLFRAAESASAIKRIINTGSSSEYGSKSAPMKEEDIAEPSSPYGIAKLSQTLIAQYFARQRNLPIVTLRLLSVFGPYEEEGRLITDVMKAIILNKKLRVSNKDAKRDFVYVDDVLDAYEKASETGGINGEVINIGGGKELNIEEAVKAALDISGSNIEVEWGSEEKKRDSDTANWVSDINKAKSLLNWSPKHTFEEGMNSTFKWFKDNIHYYAK